MSLPDIQVERVQPRPGNGRGTHSTTTFLARHDLATDHKVGYDSLIKGQLASHN